MPAKSRWLRWLGAGALSTVLLYRVGMKCSRAGTIGTTFERSTIPSVPKAARTVSAIYRAIDDRNAFRACAYRYGPTGSGTLRMASRLA